MKRLPALLLAMVLVACGTRPQQPAAHPDWSYNSVVYEMNVRQYTPEGTLAAAARHLPRLQKLGVDVVWLMPVYPIGVKERKGTLGSYYAISDYEAVNPEFGTLEDFDRFLAEAHRLGLRVILDWVANHTSPDARWIEERPADWYVRDSLGNTIVQYDWTDIAQGRKSAADLRAYVARDAAAMPREAFRLMFTSNHDENSWAGTEFERMGDAARVTALLTFTLPNGQPLVYTGQEMGFDHRFEFFEKDPVPAWEHNGFTDFYTALIRLRHENPALAAGERGGQAAYPLGERTPDGLMLFSRTAGGNEVTVAANLSAEEVAFDLPFEGSRREFFTGKEYTGGTRTVLPAWQWLVFAQDRR